MLVGHGAPDAPQPPTQSAQAVTHPADRGTSPDPAAVRPGSRQGDVPDETQGALVRQEQTRRVLGLPVDAAIVIAGVLLVLLAAAALVVPRARRRQRARGGGSAPHHR